MSPYIGHPDQETGLHTPDQIRVFIQGYFDQPVLDPAMWPKVIELELLLHLHDHLTSIESSLINIESNIGGMADDSWRDHHER